MSNSSNLVPSGSYHPAAFGPVIDLEKASDFRRPIRIGLVVIAVAFGGLGTWAATAPLNGAVIAQGVLAVESKRKVIQHLEGGIVEEILVKDGDEVAAGQVLLRLDDTRAAAGLAAIQARFDAAQALVARLSAERDGMAGIIFPQDLTLRALDPRIARLMTDERRQFNERRKSIEGQIGVLQQRIAQYEAELGGFELQAGAKDRQIVTLREEIGGLAQLTAKGFYPKNKLRALERDLAALEGDTGSFAASQSRVIESIGEAQLEILQLRQKFTEGAVSELTEATTRMTEISQELAAASDVSRRLVVTAPVAGIVQNVKIATEGGIIAAGAEIMEVVPSDDRLVIDGRIAPTDIESVAPGQAAEVRFTALNARTTPTLAAEVQIVSADALVDRDTNTPYYQVRVEVPPHEMASLSGHRLQAGMPVDVMIDAGHRTALDYMLRPLLDSFARSFREQ